jgi:hypothetical protein
MGCVDVDPDLAGLTDQEIKNRIRHLADDVGAGRADHCTSASMVLPTAVGRSKQKEAAM